MKPLTQISGTECEECSGSGYKIDKELASNPFIDDPRYGCENCDSRGKSPTTLIYPFDKDLANKKKNDVINVPDLGYPNTIGGFFKRFRLTSDAEVIKIKAFKARTKIEGVVIDMNLSLWMKEILKHNLKEEDKLVIVRGYYE